MPLKWEVAMVLSHSNHRQTITITMVLSPFQPLLLQLVSALALMVFWKCEEVMVPLKWEVAMWAPDVDVGALGIGALCMDVWMVTQE